MKVIIIFICSIILLFSCKKSAFQVENVSINQVIYKGGGVEYDLTKNKYYLNDKFIKTGYHDLGLTIEKLNEVSEKIKSLEIFKLEDSLRFVKDCKVGGCLSEIIIFYDNNRKQHFVFDNYLYKDNFSNKDYNKISNLDLYISKIILERKLNLETKYDKID